MLLNISQTPAFGILISIIGYAIGVYVKNKTKSVLANPILIAVIFIVSLLLVSVENYDFTTNFTAVAATFNNIGPGLSLVGPTCNFGFFNNFSKYVLMFDMLAGRLELFPLLILFHPSIWKELFIQADKKVKGNRKEKQNVRM